MNFNYTSKNLAMVLIGMIIAMALDFVVQEYYTVGFLELVVAGVMFGIFDSITMEGEGN